MGGKANINEAETTESGILLKLYDCNGIRKTINDSTEMNSISLKFEVSHF